MRWVLSDTGIEVESKVSIDTDKVSMEEQTRIPKCQGINM